MYKNNAVCGLEGQCRGLPVESSYLRWLLPVISAKSLIFCGVYDFLLCENLLCAVRIVAFVASVVQRFLRG